MAKKGFSISDLVLQAGRMDIAGVANDEVADIIEFIESDWGLGLNLYPVQKFILKVYYGLPLEDKIKCVPAPKDWRKKNVPLLTEVEYLQFLYDDGRINIRPEDYVPGKERVQLVLSVGRRSGKTMISACISAYETYRLILKGNPQKYYAMVEGKDIQLMSIATDKDQAGLLYQDVSTHFQKCKFFQQYMANNTLSYARFQTPQDIETFGSYQENDKARSSIRVTFKSCIAKGLRGAANLVVILDEVAHFIDKGQSGAEAVWQAVVPSTRTFNPKDENNEACGPLESKVILISSPLGRQGMFYDQFQMGMKGGDAGNSMLCVQAPTWEVNPTLDPDVFELDYLKDPVAFFTEFGAMFSDRTRGWWEREEDLLICVKPELFIKKAAPPRKPHFMGIDFALAQDGTAVAIGHVGEGGIVVADYVDQIKAGVGIYQDKERLEFEDVANWIYQLSRRFYITHGMFDQWAGIIFEQALHNKGLTQIKMANLNKQINSQIYKNFKDLAWEGGLHLFTPEEPEDEEEITYIEELLTLQSEYHSKYITTVEAPRGGHDDRSDALVRMVWLASQHRGNPNYISSYNNRNGGGGNRGATSGQASYRKTRKKALRSGSHPSRQIPRGGKWR